MSQVLIITDNAFTYTGREKICDFMTESLGDDNVIDIFSLSGEGTSFYEYKKIRTLKTFSKEKFPLIKVISEIKKLHYDYIFVVSMGKLSVLFSFAYSLLGRGITAQIYACEHVSIDSLRPYIRILKRLALKKYHKVIVLTERDNLKLTNWGIASRVIVNPISYKNFERKIRSHQAIAVGRLNQQKNFASLLKIWAAFVGKKIHQHWVLNIAGDGEEKEQLQVLAESLGISHSVNFLGRISNIDEYYQKSDVCLMTSIYEGLPLALLEAKSWSLPVIAYDCPTGPKEIIENNIDGFLIPLSDENAFLLKLELLADDDELYFKFSDMTKEASKRFAESEVKMLWKSLVSQ